jgi:hypothetical protein
VADGSGHVLPFSLNMAPPACCCMACCCMA